jgi:hypothetical protein
MKSTALGFDQIQVNQCFGTTGSLRTYKRTAALAASVLKTERLQDSVFNPQVAILRLLQASISGTPITKCSSSDYSRSCLPSNLVCSNIVHFTDLILRIFKNGVLLKRYFKVIVFSNGY